MSNHSAIVDGVSIQAGQQLIVENEPGVFRFRMVGRDGSLTVWGGVAGHESWRSFAPDRCHMPGWRQPVDINQADEKPSRASRYMAFEMWASVHEGETFTTQELADVAGFSTATMTKYLNESLTFEKQKKGMWRVRVSVGEDE